MQQRRSHSDYNQLISQYIDGELSADERALLLQHLKSCEECRRTLETYRAIGTRLRAMPPVQAPNHLVGDIFAQTIHSGPRRLHLITSRVGYSLAAVAAVILIFVVAVYLIVGGYQRRIDPKIVASQPAGDVVEWPIQLPIEISFNKEMDRASVEAALVIEPPSASEELQLTWDGNTLIIGGNQPLAPSTSYKISIGGSAQDKWGNSLGERFELAFLTSPTARIIETPLADVPTATPEPTATSLATPDGEDGNRQPQPTAPGGNPATATPLPPPPAETTPSEGSGEPGDDNVTPPDVPPAPEPTATPEPPSVPTASPVTATPSPTPPPTATPSPTPQPEPPTATPQPPTATPPPAEPTMTPTPDAIPVSGAFGGVYWGNETVLARLGLPLDRAYVSGAIELDFQHGSMFLRSDINSVYVLLRSGVWSLVPNTSENPPVVGPGPEDGTWTPGGVLGELWTSESWIQTDLGYAIEETSHPFETQVQPFELGTMLLSHTGQVYVIYDDGTWEFYTDPGTTE